MDHAAFQELERLFQAAQELPEAEREAFLAENCSSPELRARLMKMLSSEVQARELPRLRAVPPAPARIGPYRLLNPKEPLGEGGFGIVYLAEQETPIRRQVALKLIKPGMDSQQVLARFEQERKTLERMDHPHIAKVLDAGVTDAGQPYFVMEFVAGRPITAYCEEQGLDLPKRLALFGQVCAAVQHAHQKGVIHRDISPSNVLVRTVDGKPEAKVIDFGIAKAIQRESTANRRFTEEGQFIGKPAYMSPEQVQGARDVDTRSDVYGLGALLYELLTGTPPFDQKSLLTSGLAEMQRIVREVDPPRPSARLAAHGPRHETRVLGRSLRGDLDWIVMKALEKDRERRYATPEALKCDLERHLAGAPVLAAPPSVAYQIKKFVRRHRAAVASFGVACGALLAGALLATFGLLQAVDANRELRRRNEELSTALKHAVPAVQEAAAARSSAAGDTSDPISAEILEERRDLARGRGDWTEAERFARAAVEARRRRNLQNVALANCVNELAVILRTRGNLAEAESLFEEVLALRRALHKNEHSDILVTLYDLAGLARARLDHERAADLYRQAVASRRRLRGADHVEVAADLHELGFVLSRTKDLPGAIAALREAADLRRARLGDHLEQASSLHELALAHRAAGGFAAAASVWEELLALRRRMQADPQAIAAVLSDLAMAYRSAGNRAAALKFFQQLAEVRRAALGNHADTAEALTQVGCELRGSGDDAAAEIAFREAVEILRRLPDGRLRLEPKLKDLAGIYRRRGKAADAVLLYREALDIQQSLVSKDNPVLLGTMNDLAAALREANDVDGLKAALRDVAALLAKTEKGRARAVGVLLDLARLCRDREEFEEMAQYLTQAVRTQPRALDGTPRLDLPKAIQELAALLRERSGFRAAESFLLGLWGTAEENTELAAEERRQVILELSGLYEAWHAAEPRAGHDVNAAKWRAKQ